MKKQDNFLEYIPKIKEGISWKPEQDHVIIDMENKGADLFWQTKGQPYHAGRAGQLYLAAD